MKRLIRFARAIHADSLYRNSLYLMAAKFIMATLGFVFWTVNARLHTPAEIGLATTLISLTSLITSFSLLGFNAAIIRFLPGEGDRNGFVNSAYGVVAVAAFVIALGFLFNIERISPSLAFIKTSPVFMLSLAVFLVVASLQALTDSIFTALRNARYTLVSAAVFSVGKIIFTLLLSVLGAYGIFYAYVVSVNLALVISMGILTLIFGIPFLPRIRTGEIRKVWRFAGGNYLAGIIGMLPAAITPLLITNRLGAETTAYYYMPSMIIQLLLTVPRATTLSVFTEGSHKESDLKQLVFKAFKSMYSILIPAVSAVILLGEPILEVFGKTFAAEGITYLKLACAAVLVSSVNYLFGPVYNVRKKVHANIIQNSLNAAVSLSLLTIFLSSGLTGIGIAAIISNIIMIFSNLFLIKIIKK
jgi:O-antigen/teichoic acid export membrane protein